ncbi:MAG TPA: DMT family transporter [Kiloniellaceae bacterium]|nr:DMT family transporter [Kiloniellaceae bacterium]
MRKPNAVDYGLLLGVGLIWGSQFIFNAMAIAVFPPLTVAAARVFIGFLTLAAAIALLPKPGSGMAERSAKQPWGLYCAIALVEAILPCFLVPWGQQHVDSAIAAILLATVPIFTLVLAPVFVKDESWSLVAALSAIVGFTGVLVLVLPNVSGDWLADIVGELAILGGALSFALGLILMKRLPKVPPTLAMRNVFMVGSLPLVVLALIFDTPWTLAPDARSGLSLLALGVLCAGIAYVLFFRLVQSVGPSFTSLVGYLVTLFGVFMGILFLGDDLHGNDIVALALIVAALFLGRFKKSESTP